MDISNYVIKNLKECTLADIQVIAKETGIPYNTLLRIRYQVGVDPRIKTIQPVYDYLIKNNLNKVEERFAPDRRENRRKKEIK